MIEAELKARLTDPEPVRASLGEHASSERATYHDIYLDTPDRALVKAGEELRLRSVDVAGATVRHVLTYKEPAIDAESGSKPEHESAVASPDAVTRILQGLGYEVVIEFTKECENFRFTTAGRDFLATLVRVPEIDGTFLEVETMADEAEFDAAIDAVGAVLDPLGVDRSSLTTELYTDAVREARRAK